MIGITFPVYLFLVVKHQNNKCNIEEAVAELAYLDMINTFILEH